MALEWAANAPLRGSLQVDQLSSTPPVPVKSHPSGGGVDADRFVFPFSFSFAAFAAGFAGQAVWSVLRGEEEGSWL